MDTYENVELLSELAKDKSRKPPTESIEYPFAFGYFVGNVKWLLNDLNLSKKQLQILNDFVQRESFLSKPIV